MRVILSIILYFGSSVLFCLPLDARSRVYAQQLSGRHIQRIAGIDHTDFSSIQLRTLAHEFVKEIKNNYHTGTLWIVTSESDSELVQGVRATDELYGDWRMQWLQLYQRQFPVGRVSVIDGNVRLDYRLKNGTLYKEVLSQSDPLVVTVGRATFEVAYILARVASSPDSGPKSEYFLHVRPINGKPLALSREVMLELSRRLSSDRIRASLRVNSWFRDPDIPTVYPFERPRIPPVDPKRASPYESWCELAGESVDCQSSP